MTGKARPTTRILGRLAAADGAGVVRIEDRYDTDIDDLWQAITDPRRLSRWYGEVTGDLRPGGEFQEYIADADLTSAGRIEACEPPTRLLVTSRETDESWRKGIGAKPFDALTEATLTADGDQTILVIEARGLPREKLAAYGAGWQIHAENLAAHVHGLEIGDADERWQALAPAYEDLAANLG
jgi:uncharacterized protein YndB with AHSA1/START domain